MKYSKNNELLINFLKDNKEYWSYKDFQKVFEDGSNKSTLVTLKYNLIQGKWTDSLVYKHKRSLLDLCKIVKKKLDDEKEILESITEYQAVN